eukprot:CAMPEP_0169201592 /NCGR_PEP_ID=MMETSP1016-20121227/10484_1 /TAXON_ID=342587 /ORGANISM="Karlodinium micrum, Strain CCMP2283" /LENGTH=443 /DNA_ID=CAMNT_0009278517 /DNA_START=50 /DNA_END=1382 /DNA_ORIENTATION=+
MTILPVPVAEFGSSRPPKKLKLLCRLGSRAPCSCCAPFDAANSLQFAEVSPPEPSVERLRPTDPDARFPFVDTHCHLDEVLQVVQRHHLVPTLSKFVQEFTPEELEHWRILGWAVPAESSPSSETVETRRPTKNEVWSRFWVELSSEEQEAATTLGYDSKSWNWNKWPLPKDLCWERLSEEMRRCLAVLGESEASWNGYDKKQTTDASVDTINSNDLRQWTQLSSKEQASAIALGFTIDTWNAEEMADVHLDFDDEMEQRILTCIKTCGEKCVAFGEFGLDYSHPMFGKMATNRRKQREVFARQLKLAIELGKPLVIHSRGADRDTMRMMRHWVPRHWRVHVHSFRCGHQFMESVLAEYPNAYVGVPGIITMEDLEAQEICRACPLERILIETDAPYLPLYNSFYSHPGQVPDIVLKVAQLKGISAEDVFRITRENARAMYGF